MAIPDSSLASWLGGSAVEDFEVEDIPASAFCASEDKRNEWGTSYRH